MSEIEFQKRRQVAVNQIRDAIWKMQSVDETDQLINTLSTALDTVGLSYRGIGINLVNTSGPAPTARQYYTEEKLWHTVENRHEMDVILELWRAEGPVYRRDLTTEDSYGEQDHITEKFHTSIRSVVDVPFYCGTLAVNSTEVDAFSERDIAFIQELTSGLAEGFRRLDDLRQLEEHNQDLEKEIVERKQVEKTASISLALQRVRNEILQMENESDWGSVMRVLDRELQMLIEYHICGINILDAENDRKVYYYIIDGEIEYEEAPSISQVIRHVLETQAPLYRRSRAEMEQWQNFFEKEVYSVFDVPFPDGTLAVNSTHENAFDEKDIDILEQFAPVVAEGIRRLQDLRELTRREEQLRQAQKMEAVGQLTAGIAHNFNNRLMVILSNVEMAMFRGQGDSTALQAAEKSTLQAAEMVEQLMVFSRSEGGVESKPIHVQEVLLNTLEIGRETFDRKIALVDEIPRDLPLVSGDSTQLEQVFLNLLLNARDAVEESNASSPSIRMEANVISFEEKDLPLDLASRQRNYICVNVIDNGIGMDEETQQRLFEPFFTTKKVDKGTGLGMATVYAIVKDHQGWIACESQVGAGTTFSVYLSVSEQEIVSSDVEQTQTMPHGTETILLIEDEEDLRDQQVPVFKQYGYEVLVGKDGQEGWQTFEREWEHVDVVLLDLSMPNLSGQEVLARMLTLNPEVKVIVSTGYTQHSAETLGAMALLEKPYRFTQVLQTIRQVLDE